MLKIGTVEPSSADLLDRYRQGDEAAATSLFERYVERLTAMVRAQMTPSLRRRIDPEDAVQSAYRSFFVRSRDGQFTLQRSGELWKLLVTITLNKLRRQISHHRRQKRAVQRERTFGDDVYSNEGPSPLQALAAADELASFMAKLHPLQRQVLQLRLQEQRWEEIAKTTGRSPRTVRRVLADIQRIWKGLAGPLPNDIAPCDSPKRVAPQSSDVPVAAATPTKTAARLDYRDFVLEKHIGSGGMGKVFRARRSSDGQQVAVKMLRKSRWTQPGAVERFLEEARVVTSLRHPGIVEVHGIGQTPSGGPFMVMEYIEGANLATFTVNHSPSQQQVVGWIATAADALHHAHQQGIVHCDLKPSNLLLENSGRIVVSDFGLAATRTPSGHYQMWGGTLAYMAPEQLDPEFGGISPATDIFALGLVLGNLITGRVFFEERSILEVVELWSDGKGVIREMLAEAGISDPLAQVIAKCLEVDVVCRFASAAELANALREVGDQTMDC